MIKNLSIRHALQSDEWMRFQESQGKKVVKGSGKDWQVSAVIEGSHSKIFGTMKRLYAPYGPHALSIEAMKEAITFLQKTARSEGVSYIRVEPTQLLTEEEMRNLGCIKNPHDFQPSLTNVLDLTKNSEDLVSNMDYEMRRLSRQLDKRGFTFEVTYDVSNTSDFLEMMNTTADRSSATLRGSEYLKKQIEVLGPTKTAGIAYALVGGRRLSGALFYDDLDNKTRYYMHAGSREEARKVGGNPAAVLYLIFNAKESGLERFDFYGVSPVEDKSHRWAGFSKFKRDFGGVDVQYAGTWEIPVKKLQYALFSKLRSIAGN